MSRFLLMEAGLEQERDPRRAYVAVGALAVVVLVIAVLVVRAVGGPKAEVTIDAFVKALEAEDYEAAAALTTGDEAAVAEQIQANVDGLDGASLAAEVESVDEDGDEATASLGLSWDVPDQKPFEYSNGAVRLRLEDDEWRIVWSGRVIHPELREEGKRLGTVELPQERAPILDRDGAELVSLSPVVDVSVKPGDLEDAEANVATVADLTEADAETLAKAVQNAEPDAIVPVITLREEDFTPIEDDLRGIEGVLLAGREAPLAPTRDFARTLLGTVGPVTAEQVDESNGGLDADDQIGQTGLQAAYEKKLAGTPTRSVVIRNAKGQPVKTLEEVEGEPGEALQTTLGLEIQTAAEEALAEIDGNASLVALEPSTGDVLAVANRPVDNGLNLAFTGQYPPGSTFKVISTAALLADGLDTAETVDCPATINAGGREFRNFENGAAGAVPFSTDFAESCNTAFVSLAKRLDDDALTETAESFGLGVDPKLGLDAFGGDVPTPKDETEKAASMIGQGRILASPLAMAGVAATAQSGAWHKPRLVADDPSEEGEPLPAEDAEELRTLMRSVITSGTGTAVASVLGEPIGKSGTAEFGTADPPKTHAWFIAAREDIAVAVIVEGGASGGEVAAPIVASFLTSLPAE